MVETREELKAHVEALVVHTFHKLKKYFVDIPIPTTYEWREVAFSSWGMPPVVLIDTVLELDRQRLVDAPVRYREQSELVHVHLQNADGENSLFGPVSMERLNEVFFPETKKLSNGVTPEPPLPDAEIQGYVAEEVGTSYLAKLIPEQNWLRSEELVPRIVMRGMERSFFYLFAPIPPTKVAESALHERLDDKAHLAWLVENAGIDSIVPLYRDFGTSTMKWFMENEPKNISPHELPKYFAEARRYLEEHPY